MCLFNLYGAHNDVVAVGTQDMCPYNSRVEYAHPSGTPVLDPGFWLEFVFLCFSFIFVLALLLFGHVLHLWYSVFVFGNYKISIIICLSFRPFGFIAPKTLNYLSFQSFDFERTWWRLFRKRVLRTKFDIYFFITIGVTWSLMNVVMSPCFCFLALIKFFLQGEIHHYLIK
jgi:hypothetical protein